jgi:hypothetical protein
MRKQTLTIAERATGGWLNTRTGRVHKTAAHALRAVTAAARKDAKDMGEGVVTIIEWEPRTTVGQLVVAAILATAGGRPS